MLGEIIYIYYMRMIKIKPYKQSANYLCGPASLKMILSYYGVNKSEKIIAEQTNTTSKTGCALQSLIKYAKKLGFRAYFKDNFSIYSIERFLAFCGQEMGNYFFI